MSQGVIIESESPATNQAPHEPAMSQETVVSQKASNEPGSQQGVREPARSPENQQGAQKTSNEPGS